MFYREQSTASLTHLHFTFRCIEYIQNLKAQTKNRHPKWDELLNVLALKKFSYFLSEDSITLPVFTNGHSRNLFFFYMDSKQWILFLIYKPCQTFSIPLLLADISMVSEILILEKTDMYLNWTTLPQQNIFNTLSRQSWHCKITESILKMGTMFVASNLSL